MKGFKKFYTISIVVFGLAFAIAPMGRAEESQAPENEGTKPPSAMGPDPCVSVCPATDLIPTPAPVQVPPEKKIIISLADQEMWVFENDKIVERFPVSTGRPGHSTPPGKYSVHNLAPRAYSKPYDCYMLQWMAITGDGEIGMHALEGTSYERHLGHVASHGCIRLSHDNAEWLYDWVEIGTPVEIDAEWQEPPEPVNEDEVLVDYPFHW